MRAVRRRTLLRLGLTALGVAVALTAGLVGTTGWLAAFGKGPDEARMARLSKASRYEEGRFRNLEPPDAGRPGLGILSEWVFGGQQRTPPMRLPVEDPRAAWKVEPGSGLRITWLGHSTLLLELDGKRVLTDPVFSDRASPSTLVGPRRFHPVPAPLEDLPPLDAVLISHDHYDHLDMASIRALAGRGVSFFVPLGVGAHLRHWDVPERQIRELDWWGEAEVSPGLTLVATPARHFSGRAPTQGDSTLWSSWVIQTPRHRVYFSGDTGLTPQFEEIGARYGPFDLVMLEIGAYHPAWGDIHLGPDNAVLAHRMLGGGPLLPIHWGTFNLGFHTWDEPANRIAELAREHGLPLLTPGLGSPLELPAREASSDWWRGLVGAPR